MKQRTDPRHIKRIKLMQDLFTWNFIKKDKAPTGIAEIIENISSIDEAIKNSAKDRPISEINKIDLAILRLAVFELIIKREAPVKVVIDEAIELGKEFGSDSSGPFINGALGKIVQIKKIKS